MEINFSLLFKIFVALMLIAIAVIAYQYFGKGGVSIAKLLGMGYI